MTTAEVSPIRDSPTAVVAVVDDVVLVEHLTVSDPEAARLIRTAPPSDRADVLRRIISVGAHGLTTMGIGIDLATLDSRVQAMMSAATDDAEKMVARILESGKRSLGEQFDPEQRSSVMARTLAEFAEWRDQFLRTLDPGVEDSAATALLARLQALVGPDGVLEQRLAAALDIDSDESGLARLSAAIEERFAELRRDIARSQGADEARADEAERGTAHGLAFEDIVEANLRNWAGHRKGTIVERTSMAAGKLAANSRVGDFVVTLPDRHRIVVEAKRHSTIGLTGPDGILAELDRAMANRRSDLAICVAGRDAFPSEVGAFNVYGDRILVVDEGDGALTAVALQWAMATAGRRDRGEGRIDAAAVSDRIDRIRKAADSLSGVRRSVTGIRGSLDGLHETLGQLRGEVLDQVADLDRLIAEPESLGPTSPQP